MTTTSDPRRDARHMRLVRDATCAPARQRATRASARRERHRARRVPAPPLAPTTAAAAHASLAAASPAGGSQSAGLAVWALTLAAHVALAMAVWRTRPAPPAPPRSTRITVQVHDVPPPLPPPPVATPAPARPSVPRPARPVVTHTVRPPQPTPAAPPAPVKVVGLSLESTSSSGAGPAFAAGDTLAGTTAGTAAAPAPARPTSPPAPGPNRVAQGLPRAGSVLTPPRRLQEVKPHYPDAQRAAGVEADVLLVVSLDATGRVLSITVGRSSGDDAFDQSARQAARQERFSPALRDGVPIPTTFTFTTHFRLDTP